MEQPLSPPPPLTPSAADEESTLVNLASSVSAGNNSKTAGIPPKRPTRDARAPLGPRPVNSNSRQHSHSVNSSIASGVVSADNVGFLSSSFMPRL